MNYNELASEIMGTVPKISYLLAQRCVQRAWRDIRDERHWSFLIVTSQIIIPSAIQVGLVTVTQYTDTVTFDATAMAAFVGLANPVITKRQFRVNSGPIYSITAYDGGTGIATLDRVYTEATGVRTYMVYQCYYDAPIADFKRFITVQETANGYWLKLRKTMAELNKRDPQRGSQGYPPGWVVPYKTDMTTGMQSFELWPQPTSQGVLQCYMQRRGLDFSADTDAPPFQISEDALLQKAKIRAYEWAMVNVGRFPELKGVSWQFAITEALASYKTSIQADKLQDEEAFSQNYVVPDDQDCFLGPLDAKYIQSHDSAYV